MVELNLDDLRDLTGVHLILALEARKMLIELLLQQENDIRKIYIESVDRIANELANKRNAYRYIETLDIHLKNEVNIINDKLVKEFDKGITISVEAGTHQSKQATLSLLNKAKIDWKPMERVYFRANNQAIDFMHSRTVHGLNLSDRIWGYSNKTMNSIGDIVRTAIQEGSNPIEISEMLKKYVRDGAHTFAVDYPNMFERISVSMDLSYESLRLARTEMAAAFGQATIESSKINPGNKGVQWRISNAGVTCDVCLDHSRHDSGLGAGIYKVDDLPEYPAHPNCLCTLVEINEDTDDFVDKLIEWNKNPLSQPDIEKWYQDIYRQGMVA